MAGVTERLLLGHATRAPEVVLRAEHNIVYLVRPDFSRNWDGLLATEASLKFSRLVLFNLNSGVIVQGCVQMLFSEVGVAFTDGLPDLRETTIQIRLVTSVSLQAVDLLLHGHNRW